MKFSKLILSSLVLGSLAVASVQTNYAVAADNSPVIYVVNYQKVIETSKQWKNASANFQKQVQQRQAQLAKQKTDLEKEEKTLTTQMNKVQADIKARKGSGAELRKQEDALKVKIANLQKKQAAYQNAVNNLNQEFANLELKLRDQVTTEINNVIKRYANEQKITFVIDSSAAVIYDPKNDITNAIISRLK